MVRTKSQAMQSYTGNIKLKARRKRAAARAKEPACSTTAAPNAWLWSFRLSDQHRLSDATVVLTNHAENFILDEQHAALLVNGMPGHCQHSGTLEEAITHPSKKVCRPLCQCTASGRIEGGALSLNLQTSILGSASSYFRRLFTSDFGSRGWCPDCRVAVQVLDDRELEAAECVLKYMYTHELPSGRGVLDGVLLLWMIQVRLCAFFALGHRKQAALKKTGRVWMCHLPGPEGLTVKLTYVHF